MGQYYTIVNMDKEETINNYAFSCGSKLMESCYVRNPYIEAITHLLTHEWHGDRVLFCGDYAWGDTSFNKNAVNVLYSLADEDPYRFADFFKDITGNFAACKGKTHYELLNGEYEEVPYEGTFDIQPEHYRYVLNETKGVFYDREKAPVSWLWKKQDGGTGITRTDPLTLFMAIGNGLGGGDYRGMNADIIGSWAGDTLSASNEYPTEFEEIECPFDENGVFLTAPDSEILQAVEKTGQMNIRQIAEYINRGNARTPSLQEKKEMFIDAIHALNEEAKNHGTYGEDSFDDDKRGGIQR